MLLFAGAVAGLMTGPALLPIAGDETTLLYLLPGYAAAGAGLFYAFLSR